MEAHELMIGNTIDKGTIVNMLESGVHVGYGKCYTYDEISPIPLTEEWLLRFGFSEETQYYSDNLSLFWLDIHKSLENSEFYIFFNTETKYIGLHSMENENNISKYLYDIKYIHQLQNLYFALTGTHLILNK